MWSEPRDEELRSLPRLYATEDMPVEETMIYEHFFLGGCDCYVAEYDPDGRIFFGHAILNDDLDNTEWGYIGFDEPHEVQNLRMAADTLTIEWDSDAPHSGSSTVYDVARGPIEELAMGGTVADVCLESEVATLFAEDPEVPPLNAGFYYLVRGTNDCGVGGYGFATGDVPRQVDVCP